MGALLLVSLLLGAVFAPPAPARAEAVEEGATRIVRRLEAPERRQGKLPYLLYRPAGYDREPARDWPLLVYLHGWRGTGIDPAVLAKYPIARLVENARRPVPFVVLLPQCPSGRLWPEVDGLLGVIDEVAAELRIDHARIYLAGQSMGAEGVWHAAYRHPGRFAAIAPIAGPASPFWAKRIAPTPVWVFHGARDNVVPVAYSDLMVAELEKMDAVEVRYSRNEERGHEPPSEGELLELLDWLLEHRLAESP